MLLYDFMCDHELFICNVKRNINDFTYSKGAKSSYIDYIAINSYAYDNILNCEVLHHEDSNNSDHLGVSCQLNVEFSEKNQKRSPIAGPLTELS